MFGSIVNNISFLFVRTKKINAMLFVYVLLLLIFEFIFPLHPFFVVVRFYALATIRSIPSWIALCFLFPHTFMCSCIPFYLVAQPKRTHRIESIFNLCIAKHLIVYRHTHAHTVSVFIRIFTSLRYTF